MYKLNINSISREDGVCIPLDPGNADYIAYLEWVLEGNTPLPITLPTFAFLKKALFLSFNINRNDYLDALSGIAGRSWRANDTATAAHCDRVAEGLLVLKQQPEVVAATDLQGLQTAMLLCYNRLLVDVPDNVRAVFAKVQS